MNKKWLTDIPFAHRGLHGPKTGHVENSLSAFQNANKQGHGFELDVLLSKDNKAMVFHDTALKRLTSLSGNIQDYTAEELSHINLTGSDDYILTLKNILNNIDPHYPILVEIKGDQGQYNVIAKAVFEDICHYSGPIAIMSFYPDIITWFKKNAPEISAGFVATSTSDGELPPEYFDTKFQIDLIDQLHVDFIAYDIKVLPNSVTQYCRQKKIPVLTWTVRTEEQRQNAARNTDNIIYELV
ncbi:MAG: hypothetical protein K9G26_07745 [Emcibacter sp.]|nr:hypothetical protein [Emcibacter sp.]